jgi:two-component system, cell cycle sensor histidine kinase and response regulator CckA
MQDSRSEAEATRRTSEQKIRSILRAAPIGIGLVVDRVLREVNDELCRMTGRSAEELVGHSARLLYPSDEDYEFVGREKYRQIAEKGTGTVETRWQRKGGEVIDVLLSSTPLNPADHSEGVTFTALDITERKRALLELQDRNEEIDQFFSSALDLLCIADTDGNFRRLNPEWERTLGYRLDELLGRPFLDFVHPDDVAATRARMAELMGQTPVANFTNRYRHRDGSYRWIEWRSFPAGKIIYAAARDVTERQKSEAALLESERLNRMIAEMASDFIFHLQVDLDGRVAMDYASKSFTEITGRTLEQVADVASWGEFIHPEDVSRIAAGLHRVITEGQPVEVECRSLAKAGMRWTQIYARPELDPQGLRVVGIIGSSKDVTDRKRMEQEQARLQDQLQQAMKMEAIGRLAGGLAHDFNNLLTGITGNADLALMDLDPADPLAATLREVTQAARSAATLTHQLLAFSRKQMIEPRVLNLNDLLANLQGMLARLLGEDIDLRLAPCEELASVKVDPSQFEQVIVNLAVNARDAMQAGGTLVIETANVELGQDYCGSHPGAEPGRYALLAVSDTGHGMSKEILGHLFEPFFTTKPKGKGTGLGLATTYGTVKQAGGSIEVYSEVGKGTTFKIYLPCVAEKAAKWTPESRGEDLPAGHETVLLVEDEQLVRDLAARILSRLGYTVLAAKNGGEAFMLAEARPGRIDLLLTDVVMPGMSGHELANRLAKLRPEMRVLYTSGYTENVIVHHGAIDEGVHFLSKPYSPQVLARKLREVLDGKA